MTMKNKFKNKKVIVLIIIVSLLTIVTIFTYAYIRFTAKQQFQNKIATLCLDVDLNEASGSEINLLNAHPISDTEGYKLSPYTFTITNKCNTGINYEVNLDIFSDLSDKSTLALEHIKYNLNDEDASLLSTTTETNKEEDAATTSRQLKKGELMGKESITYNLRLWMDYDTTIEEGSNKSFASKIIVHATSKYYESDGDVTLAVYVDNKSVTKAPEKGAYTVSVDCKGNGVGKWDYDNWGAMITDFNGSTNCDLLFNTKTYLSDYIINKSNEEENIKHITQASTTQTGNSATEEYRYVGESSSVNNWVYFGCDSNCTKDNLYRIIGVIPTQKEVGGEYENRVKLVKASYYTETESGYLKDGYGYDWNGNEDISNDWSISSTQFMVLNDIYWRNLGEYRNFIDNTVWYLGAINFSYASFSTNQVYQYERGSVKSGSGGSLQYTNYIGLMYPSDYGFSISSNYWDTAMDSNSSAYLSTNAWLYPTYLTTGNREWFITPHSGLYDTTYKSILASCIDVRSTTMKPLYAHWVNISTENSTGYIRPTFNLKANVLYKSGDGTSSNPYRIGLN